jgi:hypothetical protein
VAFHVDIWWLIIPEIKKNYCKYPEAGVCLGDLRKSKKTNTTGDFQARENIKGNEVRKSKGS